MGSVHQYARYMFWWYAICQEINNQNSRCNKQHSSLQIHLLSESTEHRLLHKINLLAEKKPIVIMQLKNESKLVIEN